MYFFLKEKGNWLKKENKRKENQTSRNCNFLDFPVIVSMDKKSVIIKREMF